MKIEIIPTANLKDISSEVLQSDGHVKLMPASEWRKFKWDDFRMFCHNYARYGIPTIELIVFLDRQINHRTVIEIGAGAGDLGSQSGYGINNMYYKLDENKNAIPCTMEEWSDQREEMCRSNTKHVANENLDGKHVSTVWLGLDYGGGNEPPQIFETMVFEIGDYSDIYCDRYSTWQQAEEGHKKAVQWVKDGCKDE